MSATLRALLVSLALPLCAVAADSTVEHVWPEYHKADYFDRIPEFFGGKETHPGRCVLRSQPKEKAGYYFLVRLAKGVEVPATAHWRLEILRPGLQKTESFELALSGSKPERVYELGLTGSDWSDAKAHPVAWRITLLDESGKTLVTHQSLLWE